MIKIFPLRLRVIFTEKHHWLLDLMLFLNFGDCKILINILVKFITSNVSYFCEVSAGLLIGVWELYFKCLASNGEVGLNGFFIKDSRCRMFSRMLESHKIILMYDCTEVILHIYTYYVYIYVSIIESSNRRKLFCVKPYGIKKWISWKYMYRKLHMRGS